MGMRNRASFTIGQLARTAGVGIQTVRFYERRGLLARPLRLASAYRQYTPDHLKRLRFIKTAQQLGFSLKEIKALLALNSDRHATCAEVKRKAAHKRAEIVAKIQDLRRMKRALEKLSKACDASKQAVAQCRVQECFETGGKC